MTSLTPDKPVINDSLCYSSRITFFSDRQLSDPFGGFLSTGLPPTSMRLICIRHSTVRPRKLKNHKTIGKMFPAAAFRDPTTRDEELAEFRDLLGKFPN